MLELFIMVKIFGQGSVVHTSTNETRTGEERRRQTLWDKRDNNFV